MPRLCSLTLTFFTHTELAGYRQCTDQDVCSFARGRACELQLLFYGKKSPTNLMRERKQQQKQQQRRRRVTFSAVHDSNRKTRREISLFLQITSIRSIFLLFFLLCFTSSCLLNSSELLLSLISSKLLRINTTCNVFLPS